MAAAAKRLEVEGRVEKAQGLKPLEPKPLPAVIRAAAQKPKGETLTRVHIVQPGEIAGRIARKYGLSVLSLTRANPALNLEKIRPGQKLKSPLSG